MTVAPGFLELSQISDAERLIYARLRTQLAGFTRINKVKQAYYEGSQIVRQLDIAIPPHLKDLEVVAGWAGTALDVLDERLSWDNYTSTGDLMGLDEVYRGNDLDIESSHAHLDALIAGVSFVRVGKGDPDRGEPEILVTAESPSACTAIWDARGRRVAASLNRIVDYRGRVIAEIFDLPDQTITLEPDERLKMNVVDRDMHGLSRVPVSLLCNRARSSRTWGRSEITGAVRYLTDAAVRTLLGMEVNREFYTVPQRYAMGADMTAFKRADGSTVTGWEAIMGQMLAMKRDGNGDIPTVGQFESASPAPYIDQIGSYGHLLAAEVGIPASYLGYATENPASADAIRAGEARLVKRTEKRQAGFGKGWRDTAYNILLWRDGRVNMAEFGKLAVSWRDAATPTRAAAADEATKLISVGVLPPDSSVTYARVGLSAQEQAQLAADKAALPPPAVAPPAPVVEPVPNLQAAPAA